MKSLTTEVGRAQISGEHLPPYSFLSSTCKFFLYSSAPQVLTLSKFLSGKLKRIVINIQEKKIEQRRSRKGFFLVLKSKRIKNSWLSHHINSYGGNLYFLVLLSRFI